MVCFSILFSNWNGYYVISLVNVFTLIVVAGAVVVAGVFVALALLRKADFAFGVLHVFFTLRFCSVTVLRN